MTRQMVCAVMHVRFSLGDLIIDDHLCAASDMCFRPGHCFMENEISAVKDMRCGHGHVLVILIKHQPYVVHEMQSFKAG